MRRTFGLLCFLLLAAVGQSQEQPFAEETRLLTIGVGIPLNTARDKAHSLLTYNGSGFRLFIRTEEYKDDRLFRFQFSMDSATLKARVKPKQDIEKEAGLSDMQFALGWYKRIGDDLMTDNQQYVGISYTLQANLRDYPLPANNAVGFLLQNGFGISAVDRRIVEANEWTATTHVDVPLFNAIYRPSYIGLPYGLHLQKTGFKDILRNMELGTFNVFTKIAVGIDFDRQRQPWRADRYSYDWHLFYTPRPTQKSLISTTGCFMYGFNVLL